MLEDVLGLEIGLQLQELSVIPPVLVGLQEQDKKLLETNWHLGTKLKIFWNLFFSYLERQRSAFQSRSWSRPGMQQVPWEERRLILSGSIFPVSCSAGM